MTLRSGLKEDREKFEHVYRKFLPSKGEIIEVLIWDMYETVYMMRGGKRSLGTVLHRNYMSDAVCQEGFVTEHQSWIF